MAFSCKISCLFLLFSVCVCICLPHVEASTEYNRYLAHIFQKYGNGGTLTFEGLEHLMYNLGLGHIEFEPTHTIEEHRPKDFKYPKDDCDQQLVRYIEEEVVKLLPNEENDVQVTSYINDKSNNINEKIVNKGSQNATNDTEKVATANNIKPTVLLEFREMHDPKHRHPRENDGNFDGPTLSSNVCLSPKSVLRLVVDHDDLHKRKLYKTFSAEGNAYQEDNHNSGEEYNEFVNNVRLTPVAFMKICPALLAQIDQHVCARPAPLRHAEDPKELLWNAWIYASVSIFILSACGLIGILIVPLMKSVAYQEILNFLVAVAVGTLSGDAFMHLLPHALFNEHGKSDHNHEEHGSHAESEHGHDNMAVWICACAFLTALFMYVLENLLPLIKGDNNGHGHSHAHGHSHNHKHTHNHESNEDVQNRQQSPAHNSIAVNGVATEQKEVREINIMLNEVEKDKKEPSRPLTPVAFMVIIGDGLHNLTDGLAIGAAFATDPVTGMATAFAVLCHELPHELGDFALLLQTGVSLKRAIYLNIVSSVLSFVGMAVGLFITGLHSSMTQWIYASTAGSFLYIAFADLVPAMAEEGKRDFKSKLIQILGILIGGLIMLVIAVNEDDLVVLFK